MNEIEKIVAEAMPYLQKLALKAINDLAEEDAAVLRIYHRQKREMWRKMNPEAAKAQDELDARLAAFREELKLRKESKG